MIFERFSFTVQLIKPKPKSITINYKLKYSFHVMLFIIAHLGLLPILPAIIAFTGIHSLVRPSTLSAKSATMTFMMPNQNPNELFEIDVALVLISLLQVNYIFNLQMIYCLCCGQSMKLVLSDLKNRNKIRKK